jgi:hypothetical protein
MARLACSACPSLSFQEAVWDVPYSTLSYLVAAGLKGSGVKNIGRRANADLVGRRTEELIKEWVESHP